MQNNMNYIILKDKVNRIKEKIINIDENMTELKELTKESILIDNEVLDNDLFELINNTNTAIINNINNTIIPNINKKL